MPTRLMLIRGSSPLADVPVRVEGLEGEWRTDDEGVIELDVDSGKNVLHLELDNEWVSVEAEVDEHESLIVVSVDNPQSHTQTAAMGLSDGVTVGERYRIDRILGRGGMGVVFKAYDELLHRPVAIKALSDALQANEEAQRLFLDEARSLAQLSHPNLVAIHDVISQDGKSLMVTEFVDGIDLDGVIEKEAPLDSARIATLGKQLCAAIGVLHENGFIHRDIKPANAILDSEGMLKLIDFGLARSMERLMKRGTQVRGTPAYMAPEQTLGEDLSPATDVYQLGVTLYEMALAEVPFEGSGAAFHHIRDEIPRITDARPELDERLADIVARCLRKDVEARPQNACEVRDELETLLEELEVREVASAETQVEARSGEASGDAPMERDADVAHPTSEAGQGSREAKRFVAIAVAFALLAALMAWWNSEGSDQTAGQSEQKSASIEKPAESVQREEKAKSAATEDEDARQAVRAASETFNTSVLAAMLGLRYAEAENAKAQNREAPEVFRAPEAEQAPEQEEPKEVAAERRDAEPEDEAPDEREAEKEVDETPTTERDPEENADAPEPKPEGVTTVEPTPPEPQEPKPEEPADKTKRKPDEEAEDEKDEPAREAPRVF